jgi:pyruvate/2-oxoglutarate dehydrogenase complex dihydrolipoamide acyltransferase (E2) component
MKWWCHVTTPIILPDLGVGPLTLSVWFVEPGDPVLQGERVLEVLAEGATFDITAPATGKLLHKEAFSREYLTPGQVLGMIEEE